MLTINIDKPLDDFVESFYHDLYESRRKDYIHPKTILSDLASKKKHSQKRLLLFLHDRFDEIIRLKPLEQKELITKLGHLDYLHLLYNYNHRKNKKPTTTPLGSKVLNAFKYSDFRAKAYKIIDKLQIKSCVYCNAQLTINVKEGAKQKSRLQLDHFYSKDKYPFLSASFYNLIPCCSSCNQTKSNKKVDLDKHFHLYSINHGLNPFRFKIDNSTILKYLLSKQKDCSVLKIQFGSSQSENFEFAKTHDNLFNITGIYDTQKDILEEQIIKAIFYDRSMQEVLIKQFSRLFIDKSTIKRMLIGNYYEEEDIHKRPMSKLIQDISKQLNLA